jgi:hypothetical protein
MTDGPGLNARHRLRKQPCCVHHPLKASNFAHEAFSFLGATMTESIVAIERAGSMFK